jgi:hypothetical protein
VEPEIRKTFLANIDRVRHLAGFFEILSESGRGRTPVHITDILRSSVILLHATLEELLRQLIILKYPEMDEATLNEIPLVGLNDHGRPEKFFLGKLSLHRGKSIEDLLEASVRAHSNNFSANSANDVCYVLKKLGIDISVVQPEIARLDEFIQRRHHIVHQADRNHRSGKGHHATNPLRLETVMGWASCVLVIGTFALDHLPD